MSVKVSLIWGQTFKYTFLWVWSSQNFPLHQKLPHAKFWCLEVAQWSQSWLNNHQFMHIGSFLISTNSHVYRKLSLQKSTYFFIFETIAWLFSTIGKAYRIIFIFEVAWLNGSATQSLMRDEEGTELHRYPTVVLHTRVQTAEPKIDLHRGLEARQSRKND